MQNFILKNNLKKKVSAAFEKDFSKICKAIDILRDQISNANTIDDLMTAKTDFMMEVITAARPGSKTCYFCHQHAVKGFTSAGIFAACEDCEYGRINGACNESNTDTYRKIITKFDALIDELDNYWDYDKDILERNKR